MGRKTSKGSRRRETVAESTLEAGILRDIRLSYLTIEKPGHGISVRCDSEPRFLLDNYVEHNL